MSITTKCFLREIRTKIIISQIFLAIAVKSLSKDRYTEISSLSSGKWGLRRGVGGWCCCYLTDVDQ